MQPSIGGSGREVCGIGYKGSAVAERHGNILASKEHNVSMGSCHHKKVHGWCSKLRPVMQPMSKQDFTNERVAIDAGFSGRRARFVFIGDGSGWSRAEITQGRRTFWSKNNACLGGSAGNAILKLADEALT